MFKYAARLRGLMSRRDRSKTLSTRRMCAAESTTQAYNSTALLRPIVRTLDSEQKHIPGRSLCNY